MQSIFSDLKALLTKAPLPPDSGELTGAPEEELGKLELDLDIELPVVLKHWLRMVKSSCVGGGGLIGIDPTLRSLDMRTVFEMYPRWKSMGWLPVATDGSGNYYVLFSEGAKLPVAFIDVTGNPEELTYVVASGLAIFLRAFIARESGESGWPFREEFVLGRDPELAKVRSAPMPWE